jgi:hypothetical protein
MSDPNDGNTNSPVPAAGSGGNPSPAASGNGDENGEANLEPLQYFNFFQSFLWCGGWLLIFLVLLAGIFAGVVCGKVVSDIVGFGFLLLSTLFSLASVVFLFGLAYQVSFWDIPLGHRGVLLFFNNPQRIILSQGYHFLFPGVFSVAVVNVKKITQKLEPIEFFTGDNVQIYTGSDRPSITYEVSDPYLFLGISDSIIAEELNNAITQFVRDNVRELPWREVLGKKYNLEKIKNIPNPEEKREIMEVLAKIESFGITILSLTIPNLKPVNPEIIKALESKQRELLEKQGEQVEIDFLIQKLTETGKIDQIDPAELLRIFRLAQNRDKSRCRIVGIIR